jgi:hypothetical protein
MSETITPFVSHVRLFGFPLVQPILGITSFSAYLANLNIAVVDLRKFTHKAFPFRPDTTSVNFVKAFEQTALVTINFEKGYPNRIILEDTDITPVNILYIGVAFEGEKRPDMPHFQWFTTAEMNNIPVIAFIGY